MDEFGSNRGRQVDPQLRLAYAALNAADFAKAYDLASEVLAAAEASQNSPQQAEALCLLADSDRLASKFRRALDASQRAVHLFRTMGDVRGEVIALATLAHVASNLGRNEDAVEAALLSVRLAEMLPPGPQLAECYHYLGIANMWSRNWDQAHQAFDAAIKTALQCTPPASPSQPRLNQFFTEFIRHATERGETGQREGGGPSSQIGERFLTTFEADFGRSLNVAEQQSLTCLWRIGLAIACTWQRRFDEAADHLRVSRDMMGKGVSWLSPVSAWVHAELAWRSGDLVAAEHSAAEMIQLAEAIEYEQLACAGELLWSQIAQARGKHAQAFEGLLRLRHREMSIRAESILSRERVVQWQLDLRRNEISLQNLEVASRKLEKLSLEDELTGIANRRCFERELAEMLKLADGGSSLPSVALIDVDGFKGVNDSFSHQVGDEVLKGIAEVLTASIREQDLAARLSGDEFVLALRNTEATEAAQVCERIRAAVDAYDWSAVAPGLCTSISIGIAQARSGDTVATLLHLSDVAMYAAKKAAAARSGHVAA